MPERSKKGLPVILAALFLAGCAAQQTVDGEDAACVISPPSEPIACTMEYDPVCGCDGRTYSNACSARARGVPRSAPGACEGERLD